MASVVYATPGRLYLTPTTVTGTTGTLIDGIEEQSIVFSIDADLRRARTGIGANAGFRMRMGRVQAARLILPLREQSTTGLKILLSQLTTDGATIRPTGGTAAAEFAKLPTFALILRPKSSSEKYLYSPNWALSEGTLQHILHAEDGAQLAGATLELIACRPTNASGPAYLWGSSSAIASAYSLTESPA